MFKMKKVNTIKNNHLIIKFYDTMFVVLGVLENKTV